MIDILLRHLVAAPSGPVLDVGCADNHDAGWFLQRGYDVVGIDIVRPGACWNGARFELRDVRSFEFAAVTWSAIIMLNVLHKLRSMEREAVLRAAFGSLALGGVLIVRTLTVADPLFDECRSDGKWAEVEPGGFVDRATGNSNTFVPVGWVSEWPARIGAEIVLSEEYYAGDRHAPYGDHAHGFGTLVCRKPTTSS